MGFIYNEGADTFEISGAAIEGKAGVVDMHEEVEDFPASDSVTELSSGIKPTDQN